MKDKAFIDTVLSIFKASGGGNMEESELLHSYSM